MENVGLNEHIHCPFCGGTNLTLTTESFNYKAGFWGCIFLRIIGALLFGLLCRKRTECYCHNCGSRFSFYEKEVAR